MAMNALRDRAFGARKSSGGNQSLPPLPPTQNILGTIVEYKVGKKDQGADLARDVAVVALEHPVPTWGIDEIVRDENGRSTTTVNVTLPQKSNADASKGWDIFSLRYGGASTMMTPNPRGSLVAFENCYPIKEGKKNKFTNENVGPGGIVVARFISPLATPVQTTGRAADPDNDIDETPASRYVLPGQMVMTLPAVVNEQDPTRSFQQSIVSLSGLGTTMVKDEASFVAAIGETLARAEDYSGIAAVGVMALVRRDLEGMTPEQRLEAASLDDSSLAFQQFAPNRRSKVDAQFGGFVVSVSPEGLEAAKAAAPGATFAEADEAKVLQAMGGKDWAKEQIAAEGATAPVGHYLVKASPEEITAMVDAAPRDMAVHAGPEVSSYAKGGERIPLGVSYLESARSVAAGLRRVAGGQGFVDFCTSEGFTIELAPMLQYRHLPSTTFGHKENKHGRDDGNAFAVYEAVGADYDGADALDMPDGTRTAPTSRGFTVANVGLQASGASWQGRFQKPVSSAPDLILPDEIVTPNTAQEFVDTFAARLAARSALQGAVRDVKKTLSDANRPRNAGANNDQAGATAPSPAA